MKIFVKSLLLAILLLSAFGALLILTAQHAQARPVGRHRTEPLRAVVVKTADPSILQVLVESPTERPIVIELKSRTGETLWSLPIRNKQGSIRFKMNLTAVPDGEYTVVVRHGKQQQTCSVKLLTDAPTAAVRRSIVMS